MRVMEGTVVLGEGGVVEWPTRAPEVVVRLKIS